MLFTDLFNTRKVLVDSADDNTVAGYSGCFPSDTTGNRMKAVCEGMGADWTNYVTHSVNNHIRS